MIENNDAFDIIRKFDGELPDYLQELQDLILRSLAAAGWLIVLAGAVVIAEVIAIVLFMANFESWKLALGILVSIIYYFYKILCI